MFEERQRRAPPAELIRGLAVFAEPPTEEHARLAEAVELPGPPTPADYSDVFLFQLYPYASVHLGPEGMLGGEARARVDGFWRALGYDPPTEPDHLAALLGLYATLAEAEADRGGEASGEDGVPARMMDGGGEGPEAGGDQEGAVEAERRLVGEGRRALLHEHLSPWVFPFLARVSELAGEPYSSWAQLLARVLQAEVEASPEAQGLPLHLRVAPELPDPREEGAGAFVAGLLAPVRSGIILTRADLASVAAACDVGLRAGERRYALEHLLAQDGEEVLKSLGREARRQAELHAGRESWLGATAAFLERRARTTADLLDTLAEEESAREVVSS